jgi:hypothetical protein
LKDTASSPEKKDESSVSVTDGEAHEIEARRKLDMNLNEHGTENGMDTGGGVGDIPPLPPSYVKTKDISKVRKTRTEGIETKFWHHRRHPSRMTAGPNVSSRLELPWVGAPCDSSIARLPCAIL